ncbi:hypothetical protein ABEG45_14845 [Pantoea agglomerans]|uniref:hypothetical protein n=1 Tax=Enterobacter agglomerans TaxID=549 RepID=UPI0032083D3F
MSTVYKQLQTNVSNFRKLQDAYWSDLQEKLSSFHEKLISYLGVENQTLYDHEDKTVPITLFGRLNNGNVERAVSYTLDKDEETLALNFGVKVLLSQEGSELVDEALTFYCSFYKKNGVYSVVITNNKIDCPLVGDSVDFTPAFDYMAKRLYEYTDPATFK